MKNFLFFSFLFFSFLFHSCSKEKPNEDYLQTTVELSDHNSNLLSLLTNGKSIPNNSGSSDEANFRDDLVPSEINVSVSDGILSFGTTEDIHEYMIFVEYLQDNWEYGEYDQYEDTPQEVNFLGDEALNALEDELGYNSLRSKYNLLEFYDIDFENSLDFFIMEPSLQILLNEGHTLRIDSDCVKYVQSDIYAVIPKCDKRSLDIVDEYGINSVAFGIDVFDEGTGEPIEYDGEEAETRSDCSPFFLHTVFDDPDRLGSVRVSGFLRRADPDNNGSACLLTSHQIQWGDGFVDAGTILTGNDDVTHTYEDAVFSELEIGDCEDFTIKIISTPLLGNTCDCDKDSYTTTIPINICRSVPNCVKNKREHNDNYFFEYAGKEHRIKHFIGQRGTPGFLSYEKVWAKGIFYTKKNGNWRRRKPGNFLEVRVRGNILLNDCTLVDEVAIGKKKKKKSLTVTKYPNDSFGSLTEGADKLEGHYNIEFSDGYEDGFFNFPLFDE